MLYKTIHYLVLEILSDMFDKNVRKATVVIVYHTIYHTIQSSYGTNYASIGRNSLQLAPMTFSNPN